MGCGERGGNSDRAGSGRAVFARSLSRSRVAVEKEDELQLGARVTYDGES